MAEHTIKSAAAILGTSEGAIRQRLRRGTLRSVKRGGRVYVLLDGTEQTRTPEDQPESGTLISEMRARIQFLEDEHRRKDAILLNMTEAMKALSPPQEPSEGAEPHPATEEAQEGTQRPWWRRIWR